MHTQQLTAKVSTANDSITLYLSLALNLEASTHVWGHNNKQYCPIIIIVHAESVVLNP